MVNSVKCTNVQGNELMNRPSLMLPTVSDTADTAVFIPWLTPFPNFAMKEPASDPIEPHKSFADICSKSNLVIRVILSPLLLQSVKERN